MCACACACVALSITALKSSRVSAHTGILAIARVVVEKVIHYECRNDIPCSHTPLYFARPSVPPASAPAPAPPPPPPPNRHQCRCEQQRRQQIMVVLPIASASSALSDWNATPMHWPDPLNAGPPKQHAICDMRLAQLPTCNTQRATCNVETQARCAARRPS